MKTEVKQIESCDYHRTEFLQYLRDNQEQERDSFKASEYQQEQHGKRINIKNTLLNINSTLLKLMYRIN